MSEERPYIANDVSVTQFNAKGGCWVDAGIHTGQDEVFLGGWKSEMAFGEAGGVGL
jgi:hypothetical protein